MKKRIVVTELMPGEIIEATQFPNGSWKIVQDCGEISDFQAMTEDDANNWSDYFIEINPANLSMKDKFMRWTPRTETEEETKHLIIQAMAACKEKFFIPRYSPSLTEDGENIRFAPGKSAVSDKSYNWWFKVADDLCLSRKSHIMTDLEYGIVLGTLIKNLVASGKRVRSAWNEVCNNSSKLGHYHDSKNSRGHLEPTGSRPVCGFYDLGNTPKILAETKSKELGGYFIAGGGYTDYGKDKPIGKVRHFFGRNEEIDGVALIVFSEETECAEMLNN